MNTRRQFLKQSSIFAVAAMAMPGDIFAAAPKSYFGVQLYTLRKEMEKDPVGTLQKVAKLGYTAVETYGYKDGKWFGLPVAEFKNVLKANNLSSPSGHTFGGQFFLSGSWQAEWTQAVKDAKTIGQQFIVVPYLDAKFRDVDSYKKLAPALNEAGKIAKVHGLKLAYHNHDFEFADQNGQTGFDILMANTDPKLVSFELDIYWATKAGYNAVDLFKKHPGRFAMWHVKDMDNTPEKKFTEVGNGTIDFKTIFQNKKESGMKYWFVEQDICPGSPLDSIQQSITNLKKGII